MGKENKNLRQIMMATSTNSVQAMPEELKRGRVYKKEKENYES